MDVLDSIGFTLTEVLIAVLILVAAIIPLMTAFIHGTRWTAESRDLITAVNLAQGKLEELKNRTYANLEAGEPTDPNQPPRSFTGYPGYAYRVAVAEIDVSGDGKNDLKTVTAAVYETATGREVVSLTMDRGDWQ
ncbi:MAG: type IV pilus modification PilV family protein [Desulfotomaculales bacterium]